MGEMRFSLDFNDQALCKVDIKIVILYKTCIKEISQLPKGRVFARQQLP